MTRNRDVLNRDVFQQAPGSYRIPNDGVAKIVFPPASGAPTQTLKDELRTFITDGEFGRGLLRILESFRSGLGQGTQKAVWISGFYGSGKSHLAKMLCSLWTDQAFEDGSRPSTLIPEPAAELAAELRALRAGAERAGGLHAAGGTLGGGADDPKLATLGIVLQSVGLPLDFRAARVAFWLADEGILEGVRARLGGAFEFAIRNFVLATAFHEAVLAEKPSLAANSRDLSDRLKANFPQPPEITVADLSSTVRRALLLNRKELPLTLVVLDEVQQFLKNDPGRVLDMQNIAERFAADFDGRLLLVGTGQQALNELENLQKLLGRFQVRINLGEADMDSVIRKTVLRKSGQGADQVRAMLEARAGEISRQLRTSRVAHRPEDNGDAVLDWPLLPSRRRVWERVLRVLDRSGMAGALRTQMAVALESARLVAGAPLGHAVPADFLYSRFADDAFAAGELPEETRARISKLCEGGEAEHLQARVLMLVYMLGLIQGDAEFHGVRATADTIADLLIEDLSSGSDLRAAVPVALAALGEAGAVMHFDSVWRLQTKEAAEWDAAYRAELRSVRNNPSELANRRRAVLDAALSDALKGLSAVAQGRSSVSRRLVRLRPDEKAPADGLPVRIHNGWDETLKSVVADIAAQPETDATIHLLIERKEADRLEESLRQRLAAQTVLDQRGAPATVEGDQAQKAMSARVSANDRAIKEIVEVAVRDAKVVLAGGSEQSGTYVKDRLYAAAQAALVRLYPQFDTADDPGWERVVKAAQGGQADALKAVGHNGSPETHPVCQTIRARLGAGRKGKELRDEFEGVPYGWPQDAVDGALLVLAHAGLIRTLGEDGREAVLRSLPRQKIGLCRFLPETHTVTTVHKRAIRALGQAVGVTVPPDQEAEQLPLILNALGEAARAAGGDAPAPPPPATPGLDVLAGLSGNERLIEVASRGVALAAVYAEWMARRGAIATRMPAYRTMLRLVELGAHGQQAAVEEIRTGRRLLEEPDPVPPLRQNAAAELRQRLNAAFDAYAAALEKAEAALRADTNWQALAPDDKRAIRAANGLLPVAKPEVASPEDIVTALNARSFAAWGDLTRGLPAGVQVALDGAAERLQPQVQPITLPAAGTVADAAALEAWLGQVRAVLLEALARGPVRPRF
jgi:hypothetical protein